eukprot:CAMPEP_0204918012 /NCGR_PEP_ID=MMETSP1397-20131031/15739_1 /ASSEMBLY_ACC=CAM_ASM_000891 /TAXON_ID=49980 /ORGANISM="Climacostomum Climacostomum virens, Strain Stock W-24" /LENGTH=105 /DNA_ID=CAMNT_0052091081 /DNA_START=927 /DNA_END=1244 /DNA_ORIENTATION=+
MPSLAVAVPCIAALRFVSVESTWVLFIIVPVLGILTGGPSCIVSSTIATELTNDTAKKAHSTSKSTVVGLINGSGGLGAASAQFLIGMLVTVSWNWTFIFVICEL